ncbi:ABC transporter family substrate-binding protein [Marisediminicola antarctica]|uniref:Peptide ABC transporter substrate-binding protein n=1 Tax=Marisediminicola antarctica TaxID=674079 RepID=A0A7L5AFX8_9MICO|nr:ABC transporter family substrate-binding protein [Marisediminicola antarctica]QHO69400.1 peptide ABC transporter substrate-binding protein [Marisediminicola antarctica]
MKISRLMGGVAVVSVGALALTGCTPPRASEVIEGTSITVAWNDSYYAFNDGLADTNASSNAVVNYMAKDGFQYYDNNSALIPQTAFGSIEKTSDDPLTVKYTVNEDVTWSDGTPVDAADLLLYWAAFTTHVQNGAGVEDEETFELTGQEGTFWNTGTVEDFGLDLVEETPEIGDDGRSITLVYSDFYVDWQLGFAVSPVSAHGTVQLAYPGEYDDEDGAEKAKDDIIKAIQDKDFDFLAPVSESYNQDYKFTDTPEEPQKLYGTGAYTITEINSADKFVTLTANPEYTWGPSPKYETITVRVIPDAQAQLTALANGEVSIVAGQPTADIAAQLEAGIAGVEFSGAPEGTYEHIDLQVTNGGVFDPATYGGDEDKALAIRQAFLKTIPRGKILETLIKPLQPDAELRNSQIFLPGTPGAEAAAEVNGTLDLVDPDIEGAKALLAEAGVTTVDVRMLFSSTNPRRGSEYTLIAESAKEAGINVINASSETWGGDLDGNKAGYDAALFGWNSTSTAIGESGANYQTTGLNNFYGWSNAELDDLFDQLGREPDEAKQQEILVKAEEIIGAQAWSVPIFQFPGITSWSAEVDGVVPGFLSPSYFWNFWEWAPAE